MTARHILEALLLLDFASLPTLYGIVWYLRKRANRPLKRRHPFRILETKRMYVWYDTHAARFHRLRVVRSTLKNTE